MMLEKALLGEEILWRWDTCGMKGEERFKEDERN